jgi:hypothetical protein
MALAFESEGVRMAIRRKIIVTTTSSSTRVKPCFFGFFAGLLEKHFIILAKFSAELRKKSLKILRFLKNFCWLGIAGSAREGWLGVKMG